MKETKDYDERGYEFTREYRYELMALLVIAIFLLSLNLSKYFDSSDRVIVPQERKDAAMELLSPFERVILSRAFERSTYVIPNQGDAVSDLEDQMTVHILSTRDSAPKNPRSFLCNSEDYGFINRFFSIHKGEMESYKFIYEDFLTNRSAQCRG